MMKFPDFGKRRSNENQPDAPTSTDALLAPDLIDEEVTDLTAAEASEIRDAFNLILQSEVEPLLAVTDRASDGAAGEDLSIAADLKNSLTINDLTIIAPNVMAEADAGNTAESMALDPSDIAAKLDLSLEDASIEELPLESGIALEAPLTQDGHEALLSRLNLSVTPLFATSDPEPAVAETILVESGASLAMDHAESAVTHEVLNLDLTLDNDESASSDSTDPFEVRQDGPLTYFQYYLNDNENGAAAEYNPISLRRPSMPTGLIGAGILGATLISGFSIADAMKQGQPTVAKRPTAANPTNPLQDLKAPPAPLPAAAPETLKPEASVLAPPAPTSMNVPSQALIAANSGISQPNYGLQQNGTTISPIGQALKEIPAVTVQPPIAEMQSPPVQPTVQYAPPPMQVNPMQVTPVQMNPEVARDPGILPPPPLPAGILSEPQPAINPGAASAALLPTPPAPESMIPAPESSPVQPVKPLDRIGTMIASPSQATSPKPTTLTIPKTQDVKFQELLPQDGKVPVMPPDGPKEIVFNRTTPLPPNPQEQQIPLSKQPNPVELAKAPSGQLETLLVTPKNNGFLAEEQALLRSLSQQEAKLLTNAPGIEPFTKRTLGIRDYARAYQVASKQVNGLPPFGFIDYLQKVIVLPDESAMAGLGGVLPTEVAASPGASGT